MLSGMRKQSFLITNRAFVPLQNPSDVPYSSFSIKNPAQGLNPSPGGEKLVGKGLDGFTYVEFRYIISDGKLRDWGGNAQAGASKKEEGSFLGQKIRRSPQSPPKRCCLRQQRFGTHLKIYRKPLFFRAAAFCMVLWLHNPPVLP